jgi:hypothetical protein
LQAVDSQTLEVIAADTGFGIRTLWDYRKGHRQIPEPRLRALGRALGLK